MLKHRVIPCILLQDGGVVKTRKFKNPIYVGDPINAVRIFNEKEVDELIVIDILASTNGAEPDYDLIEKLASECFMPLCYGGGIQTLDQAKRIITSGVEKICIQSAFFRKPGFVNELANNFGRQSIVLSIDIKRNWLGQYQLYNRKLKKGNKKDWFKVIEKAVSDGAGEILLNSVNCDGEMDGYDLKLIEHVVKNIPTPVIAIGGAGELNHFKEAVNAGASAVAAGSLFVFQGVHRAVLINYPPYKVLESLLQGVED